jgi:hypothetical protein
MTKPEKAASIAENLTEKGYRPKIDEDNDITLQVDGILHMISLYDNDEIYYDVLSIINESGKGKRERALILQLCNDISAKMKTVKAYHVGESVVFKYESFHASVNDFIEILPRAMKVLNISINEYKFAREGAKSKLQGE